MATAKDAAITIIDDEDDLELLLVAKPAGSKPAAPGRGRAAAAAGPKPMPAAATSAAAVAQHQPAPGAASAAPHLAATTQAALAKYHSLMALLEQGGSQGAGGPAGGAGGAGGPPGDDEVALVAPQIRTAPPAAGELC